MITVDVKEMCDHITTLGILTLFYEDGFVTAMMKAAILQK